MIKFPAWTRAIRLLNDNKGPWGSRPGGDGGSGDASGPTPADPPTPGPWGQPGRSTGGRRPSASAGFEEFLRRSRLGGGPGNNFANLPGDVGPGAFKYIGLAIVAFWLLTTSVHSIAPAERGVVTQFGRFNSILGPGVNWTLPAPIARVQKIDVDNIREVTLGGLESEDLMLTGDKNIIDIAYQVRWKIRSPEKYLFELKDPDESIKQVAESTMRAVIANVSLQDAIGLGRTQIEARVQDQMQRVLDRYQAGVDVQGIAIKQADPPAAVNDAFKEVTAAQQDAQTYVNQANAYSLQLTAQAQGEATAFDKVYEQYRLAPDVTKRRMYYETMEKVLGGVDKTVIEAPGVNSYLPLNRTPPAVVADPGNGR